MDNYIGKFRNSNINIILEIAEPKIQEMTEKYIQKYFETESIYPTNFAIEMYKIGLIYDLVKALSKYIEDTDELTKFELSANKGIFVIIGSVTRNGVKYFIYTDMILAGGYNIQCLHYRYIVKTKLPKTAKENSLATRVKNLIKSKNAIQRLNEDELYAQSVLVREVEEIKSKMAMTDEQIISQRYWLTDEKYCWDNLVEGAKQNYGSEEAFIVYKNNEKKQMISSHRASYSQKRIEYLEKEYKKKIEKINIKRNKLEL